MTSFERKAEASKKQRQALRLRTAGMTYEAIAEKVGYNSPQAVWKAVNSALKKTRTEGANELRTMEVRRLDEALAAIWVQVIGGNLRAVDRFIRLSERRAALLGLDAPKKTEVSGPGGERLEVKLIEVVRGKDA